VIAHTGHCNHDKLPLDFLDWHMRASDGCGKPGTALTVLLSRRVNFDCLERGNQRLALRGVDADRLFGA
jgi:hypothetical protein